MKRKSFKLILFREKHVHRKFKSGQIHKRFAFITNEKLTNNCHVDVKNKPEWGSCGVVTTAVNTCTC